MATPDADTQNPVFWERLQGLFARDEDPEADRPQRRGLVILFCALISFVMWFAFTLQEVQVASIEVPTRLINLRPDEALTEVPPEQVQAQVRGEGVQMLQMALDPPVVPINAAGEEVNLRNALNLPPGLVLVNVFPQYLTLEKEPRVSRYVPVRLRGRVETPPTHDLIDPPEVVPDSVRVTGAQSIVDSLAYWPTDSVVVRGVTDTLVRRVALADTLAGLVVRGMENVVLTARAQQFTEAQRTIDVHIPGSPERSVTLEPPSVHVRYRVPVGQYQRAQEAPDFFATVSYDQIRTDTTGRVTPRVHTPSYLEIRDVEVTPSFLRYYDFIPSPATPEDGG